MEQNGRTNGGLTTRSNGNGAVRDPGSGDSGDDLDQGVATRLRELGRRIAPAEISDVWVFPPLAHLEGSAEFLLFTRILPDEMRRLCGAEFLPGGPGAANGKGNGAAHTNGNGNGAVQAQSQTADGMRRITEYGAVPSHRVSRLVAGFRERLGDHRNPLHFAIGGSAENWGRLVEPEAAPSD